MRSLVRRHICLQRVDHRSVREVQSWWIYHSLKHRRAPRTVGGAQTSSSHGVRAAQGAWDSGSGRRGTQLSLESRRELGHLCSTYRSRVGCRQCLHFLRCVLRLAHIRGGRGNDTSRLGAENYSRKDQYKHKQVVLAACDQFAAVPKAKCDAQKQKTLTGGM
jgi:hypothetical protein